MAERDVIFTLRASADPKAASAAKDFETLLIDSQKKVFKSAADFDKERVRVGKLAQQQLLKFAEEHRDAILADAEVMKSFTIRMGQATAKELNRIDAAQARTERSNRDRENGLKVAAQRDVEKKAEADGRAALAKRLADFKKAKAEELAITKRTANEKAAAEESVQRNRSKYQAAARNLREQFSELSESVMRVGRGITLLGLAGEKDLAKVQEGLLKAQAAMDIFSGGLKVISKLERAWASYIVMIEAANAAMATHNALSMLGGSRGGSGPKQPSPRGGGSGILGLLGMGGLGAASGSGWLSKINPKVLLGQAPKVVPDWNTGKEVIQKGLGLRGWLGGAAQAAGAPTSQFAGRVGTGLMIGKSLPVVGQIIRAGGYGYTAGSIASNFIGVKSLGGAIGRYSSSLKKDSDGLDKFDRGKIFHAERNANIDDLYETALGKRNESAGKVESLSSSMNSARINDAKSSLDITTKTLGVESKIAGIRNKMNLATTTDAKVYLATQLAAQEVMLAQLAASKAIADDAAKITEINAQRAKEEQRIYSIRKQMATLGDDEMGLRDTLRSEMEGSANKLIALTQQRGEVEKSIAATRAQSARTALDSARKELDTVTSRIKSEQDALKTAEERFGLMSRADQNEVMQLLLKARAGKQLNADQVNKLKSLGTTEAERLASAQARNLAKGDYSGESRTLKAIEESNRRLQGHVADITEGATNKYGVNRGSPRMLSRRQKEEVAQTQYAMEANERRAEQIRIAAARDTALRRSIFGEERGALSQSLGQKSMIEAKISQQLTVVARFDNTAKQVADMAVQQLLVAQAPWIAEFERRLGESMKDLNYLKNQRRQTATGRT